MSNEQLLDDLVAGLQPVRRRRVRNDVLALAGMGAAELALFLILGAGRDDLLLAINLPSFWWKLGSLGLLTLIGVVTAIRSFDPVVSPRRGLRTMAYAIAATLVAGWVIDAASSSGSSLWDRLMWRHGIDCVFAVTVLSLPPIIALGILMRRGAPTDSSGSALAVGAASAAWGAFIFVFNCPHDDPLYIAVWYAAACTLIVLAARLLLPLITRW